MKVEKIPKYLLKSSNKCVIKTCTSRSNDPECSFHTFPSDPDAKAMWCQQLQLENVTKISKICSRHFKKTDLIFLSGKSKYPMKFMKYLTNFISILLAFVKPKAIPWKHHVTTDNQPVILLPKPAKKVQSSPVNVYIINDSTAIKIKPKTTAIAVQTQKFCYDGINCASNMKDKTFQSVTGLERERFEIIFKLIQDYDKINSKTNISDVDQLVLTLNKYRDNPRNTDLG